MTIKTLAAAAALTLIPALAIAQGCSHSKQQAAISCAEGSTYDYNTGQCVPTTS